MLVSGRDFPDISIHALREEGDEERHDDGLIKALFLSTPSARRATWRNSTRIPAYSNFYPRPPRGGRRSPELYDNYILYISIHALREEGDVLVHGRHHRSV